MILTDLYRGKISPYSSVVANNKESRDRLDAAQEAIIQALPEEKKPLIDASQDAFMTLIMDEAMKSSHAHFDLKKTWRID